ncbi:uroporphyrinogen-III synthase [Thermoflavimicrobium dichotomicum]|uniref:Uroporphyrinogen-III synthase n=1 Tax=Thermoflavimicrobium dichotomicum TaxID=46223 RepID=A0A1I3P6C6_9BACL|nr:uroporphyrinogen-III synthase [Thermoflavimicrobium dichotomicum]SFJ16969.1 uroporphyrinogen-III synthase [Thermoflavimicrobium dichotomicum]
MTKRKLDGKRIVLTGTRKLEEMSKIVEKQGGIPLIRSLNVTIFFEDEKIKSQISRVVNEKNDWFIFTTGIGVEKLLETARNMGVEKQFVEKIKQAKVAGRGIKVVQALKKLGVDLTVRDEDGTTDGLIRPLEPQLSPGDRIAIQLYGDSSLNLIQMLKQKDAQILEILPYQQIPPDTSILETISSEIVNRKIDAITFTSGAPVPFLFDYVKKKGLLSQFLDAFSTDIVVAAVGKFTAQCLRNEGVERIIVPQEERMGSMIIELANYFQSNSK